MIIIIILTRLHSSGMHTAHLLTVSQHALRRGCTCTGGGVKGVPAQGGCTCPGGYLPGRSCVYLPRGGGGVVYLLGVYLPEGVPAQGLYLPGGGCTCQKGGVPASREVYLPVGRCTCQGVYLSGVYLPGVYLRSVPASRGCTCQNEQND